jgi:hypothetical protein
MSLYSSFSRTWCLVPALMMLFGGTHASQTELPERKVQGDVLTSEHDPQVRITLPASAQYVGADRWILFGFDDCELHAFVDADPHETVRRLYWIQFESYLPSRPELHHTYDSPRHAEMAGMDFYVDTWPRATDAKIESGSDFGHLMVLIRRKGYNLPAGMIYARFVHLLDKEKRKELMIIYAEDLDPDGLSAADLLKGGKAHSRWPSLERNLIDRAEQNIELETPSEQ